MSRSRQLARLFGTLLIAACAGGGHAKPLAAAEPATGPTTEKRFPPLQVPAGFQATLFACDPLIEYPSAVALGPRPASLFVAIDYLTGLGTEIVRRDEIRLIEDTQGDGYADRATVYAGGFNSLQGLTFHAGSVYAMHSPDLTLLRDTNGDGQADLRQDLLTGLGLPPEKNPVRLHCANGLVMGHDGWLYLALGDHGCDVPRPEGDRLVLNGGGILRCRPDGSDLHVFATGLRNIYDVALDDDLNVFVRDNENDGGNYKIRVCHSFWGADHGYPYHYTERPDEALAPLADLGLGSSAGGLAYRESQFPAEYRGNLFFCEWGRAVVHYRPQRTVGRFGKLAELTFAAGDPGDPYGFKPTDLVVERDGSLIVADWADGQRPNRGRGRIYRIRHSSHNDQTTKPPDLRPAAAPGALAAALRNLDSESAYERVEAQEFLQSRGTEGLQAVQAALDKPDGLGARGRLQAVWILARQDRSSAGDRLLALAAQDAEPRVRVQAIRALADLADPGLARHRRDSRPADSRLAEQLAALFQAADPLVKREIVIALGRLRWAGTPAWMRGLFAAPDGNQTWAVFDDPAFAHAAQNALRRSANWPVLLGLLDLPDNQPLRAVALRALAEQAVPEVVDGLIARLGNPAESAARRSACADLLTRVHNRPAPWEYWGFKPAPRPENTVAWERTLRIQNACAAALGDPDRSLRLAVLRRMQRERIPAPIAALERWLADERGAEAVAALLASLGNFPADDLREPLARIVAEPAHAADNRLRALNMLVERLDQAHAGRLLELAGQVEEGPLLAVVVRRLGRWPQLASRAWLEGKLSSPQPAVRAAAADTLAELRTESAGGSLLRLLDDDDAGARRAAAAALGRLNIRTANRRLLELAADREPQVRLASLESLRILKEPRGVALAAAALDDRVTQLAALAYLVEFGGEAQAQAVLAAARRDPTPAVTTLAVRFLDNCRRGQTLPAAQGDALEKAVAELQGSSGMLVAWQVSGAVPAKTADSVISSIAAPSLTENNPLAAALQWRTLFGSGLDARVTLAEKRSGPDAAADTVWLATSDLDVPEAGPVQFLGSSAGRLQVWLNGTRLYERDKVQSCQPDSDRLDGSLRAGRNRVAVLATGPADRVEFHLRFRRKSSVAEQEQYVQAALARNGNGERGRKVFFDEARSRCSRCHRIDDQGERIGPELSGLGDRFSRIHIVESILEPSRTVATGFQTHTIVLKSGKAYSGIKLAETETELTLADNQGQKHLLPKSEIEEQQPQAQSTMPDGVAKQLSVDEFVDLIAFLTTLKRTGPADPP